LLLFLLCVVAAVPEQSRREFAEQLKLRVIYPDLCQAAIAHAARDMPRISEVALECIHSP
jgi:hypothetical protein